MIQFQPLGARVVVVLQPLPEKIGSLVRIGTNEIARRADVVRVGPECRECSVGQTVIVNPLSGQWIGDELVLPEASVLAFVELSQIDDDNERPALTPREWQTLKLWNAGKMIGGKIRGQVVLGLADDQRFAAAAVALYGEPYGFSWEDVWNLRNSGVLELRYIADRIAALLPPEET